MIDLLFVVVVAACGLLVRWSEQERRRLRDELDLVDRQAETLVDSEYSHPLARAFFESRVTRSLLLWALIAGVWALDRDGCVAAQQSAIFGALVSVFEAISSFFGDVGAAVAGSLVAAVSWLVATVGWLWTVVKDVMVGTGAIFARVWDGLGALWSDVIKPAFQWLDSAITRLRAWLKDTFQPVFEFLRRVRDVVTGLYKTFIKPIFAVIDFIRQLDRTLQVFHIHLLTALDAALTKLEQRIEQPILWIYSRLADVFNILNTIVSADGFFNRYTFLKTAERDAVNLVRLWWNAQSGDATQAPPAVDPANEVGKVHAAAIADELTAYAEGQPSDFAAEMDKIVAIWGGAIGASSAAEIELAQ